MRQVLLCALLLAGPAVPAAPQAAPQAARDPIRFINVHQWHGEVSGTNLCTDKKGTGPNAATRDPFVRFGDARQGNCAGQLRVKDWGP